MLVIFDCDGVLVDSEIIAARVEARLLTEAGYEISPEEMATRFAGLTGERIWDLAEAELGRPVPQAIRGRSEEEIDKALEAGLSPVAGVEEMLDRLDAAICICSNSTSARLEMELRKTGLYDRFRPFIYSARDLGEGKQKPAPDVFLHAAKEFSADPAEVIVVEDSTHGVAGAVAAGMRVIGFTGASHSWPGHADALTEAGAVTVVNRLALVPQTVAALAAWSALA
ncbi:HAD family phosphatase [Afifella sp. IM 167]|uniref:HAD family hydrolase n=1 Tax=Afifella sp. IM 167 TaxID=2033586 RepID=UPI001CCB511D|nr:HAD family hydrolase [Afifella sp. IM 167]MBZ8133441.1 HAD family hydrolase [Afifella sp. IM 167]